MKILSGVLLAISFWVMTPGPALIANDAPVRMSTAQIDSGKISPEEDHGSMAIKVTANGKTTVFELNGSSAARDLLAQLPLSIQVENYGNNEKIFYPPKKLDVSDTPLADARAGTLAYYAPWADVVMFYADFGSASGLYLLGQAISGADHIREMSGTIMIEKLQTDNN